MGSKELIHYINNDIPIGEEWWREENKEVFHKAAGTMLAAGINIKVIKEILNDLYNAVASEYGE